MISGRTVKDSNAISLIGSDFDSGGLSQQSNVRPNRLFTADSRIILRSIGKLSDDKMQEVVDAIIKIIQP